MAPPPPLIQPPPMAYSPATGSAWYKGQASPQPYSPESAYGTGQSPFSPTLSSPPTSPGRKKENPSLESPVLGKALSDSSDSTASSPARSSYGGFAPHTLRPSQQPHRESNSHRASRNVAVRDVEKQQVRNSRHTISSKTKSGGYATTAGNPRDEISGILLESKAAKILVYLAVFNPFVSIVILLYTVFAMLALLLLQPFRICTKTTTFRLQVIGFLAPALKVQLAFIYSPDNGDDCSAPLLVMINLLSPIISFGVSFAAWVAAAFWFFNAILGDPDGSDKPRGYNDGRASVIGVRKWWERWLTRAMR